MTVDIGLVISILGIMFFNFTIIKYYEEHEGKKDELNKQWKIKIPVALIKSLLFTYPVVLFALIEQTLLFFMSMIICILYIVFLAVDWIKAALLSFRYEDEKSVEELLNP